ncbi:ANT(3'') family aminoglycoside nucleotidyltransferase, partial [Klebsiella pneumoniae]
EDGAGNCLMECLPAQQPPVLLEAPQAYLGQGMDCLASRADQFTAFIYFVKHKAASLLGSTPMTSNSSFKPTPLRGAA